MELIMAMESRQNLCKYKINIRKSLLSEYHFKQYIVLYCRF